MELEALKELKGKHPAATDTNISKAESALKKMIAYDKAVFEILASDKAEAWKAANLAYNEAREKAGKIDPFNPNYDLGIPLQDVAISDINPEGLLRIQAARAELVNKPRQYNALKNVSDAFSALKIHNAQDIVLQDKEIAEESQRGGLRLG